MFVVPLFKMTSRRTEPGRDDDYLVPHWINLSFYTTNRKIGYSNFIPRIKLPPLKCATLEEAKVTCYFPASVTESQPPESPFTYDEYDAKVFEMPRTNARGLQNCRKNLTGSSSNISSPKKDPVESGTERGVKIPSKDDSSLSEFQSRSVSPRKMSSAITIPSQGGAHHDTNNRDQYSKTFSGQLKTSRKTGMISERGVRVRSILTEREDETEEDKPVWGSAGAGSDIKHLLFRPGRALVNPFDPRNVRIKRSSNRRRWTHIFPQLPSSDQSRQAALPSPGSESSGPTSHLVENNLSRIADFTVGEKVRGGGEERDTRLGSLMWGVTGDLPWDATIITGVDWRSITWPACLPITTDYFPDKRAFDNDYVVNQYVIIPDEINSDYASRSSLQKAALTTREVFMELICQRLSQGFQLIINPSKDEMSASKSLGTNVSNLSLFGGSKSSVTINNMNKTLIVSEYFWLSIGKNFHHLSLTGNKIDVIIYRPKHPYPALDYHYIYRFMAPDNDTYEVSWVEFNMEKLENYSWNYLDHYVTTRGDQDYELAENLKYWRFRMYILPLKPFVPFTSSIRDGPAGGRCDLYKKPAPEEYVNLAEGFMRSSDKLRDD